MRINDPKKTPFGKQLKEHGVILEWVAKSRIEIDAARLVVLNAAIKVDQLSRKLPRPKFLFHKWHSRSLTVLCNHLVVLVFAKILLLQTCGRTSEH
jgi:hypothetical protein